MVAIWLHRGVGVALVLMGCWVLSMLLGQPELTASTQASLALAAKTYPPSQARQLLIAPVAVAEQPLAGSAYDCQISRDVACLQRYVTPSAQSELFLQQHDEVQNFYQQYLKADDYHDRAHQGVHDLPPPYARLIAGHRLWLLAALQRYQQQHGEDVAVLLQWHIKRWRRELARPSGVRYKMMVAQILSENLEVYAWLEHHQPKVLPNIEPLSAAERDLSQAFAWDLVRYRQVRRDALAQQGCAQPSGLGCQWMHRFWSEAIWLNRLQRDLDQANAILAAPLAEVGGLPYQAQTRQWIDRRDTIGWQTYQQTGAPDWVTHAYHMQDINAKIDLINQFIHMRMVPDHQRLQAIHNPYAPKQALQSVDARVCAQRPLWTADSVACVLQYSVDLVHQSSDALSAKAR